MKKQSIFFILSFIFLFSVSVSLSLSQDIQQIAGEFGKHGDYAQPMYKSLSIESKYITMRDGIKIASDIALPEGLPSGEKIPAIMRMTRYWRAAEGAPADFFQRFFTSHGYAYISVDARGSGASFGHRNYLLHNDEIKDFGEVVDWIITQNWSNGKVGSLGISYEGSTAELIAANMHPAVKAVIPRFNEFDDYTDIIFPGGILLAPFLKLWDDMVTSMDTGEMQQGKIKPVDEDTDKQLLKAAIKDHEKNWEVYKTALLGIYRDTVINGFSADYISPFYLRREII